MRRSFLMCLAVVLLTAGVAKAVVWNPTDADSIARGYGYWDVAANWTGGLPTAANVATFNAADKPVCWVTGTQPCGRLELGVGAGPCFLTVKNGGRLSLGNLNNYNSVGRDNIGTLTIEKGGIVTSTCRIEVGRRNLDNGAPSYVNVDGGTLELTAGNLQIGYGAPDGWGKLRVDNNGLVNVKAGTLTNDNQNSSPNTMLVDVGFGTIILNGDQRTFLTTWKNLNQLVGFGGAGIPVWDYDVTNAGKTTITAIHPMIPSSPTPSDGGTNAALSATLSWETLVSSLTYDVYFGTDFNAVAQAGDVDFDDLLLLAEQWLGVGDLQADRNNDNKVNFIDFASLALIWGQRSEDSPVYKGNQTSRSYNPVGLAEATQYYWRVDAVDASNNVYPGDVWTFGTYNTTVIRQQMLAKYDNEGVPYVLNNQKLPGYNPTGDPHDILAGQINSTDLDPLANSFNQRNEGAIYPLAFCYVNPNSIYYRNANVLYRILLALDYSCRAQGKNGGFNEKIDTQNGQYGWCGVTLPDGGNNTRTDGASTVMGFPFFCIGRSIVMLQNEPAFISALDTVYIDNDGNGTADVKRRDAYKYMFNDNINGGTQTGIIQCMMTGKCKGGHPNQDGGAMAAVQACNEAYTFLNNGTPYISQAALDHYRDHVLFDNASLLETWLDPTRRNWWSDKYMILEVGHGGEGYDTGYGNIPPSLLGSYARHTNDSVVGNFITNYMNGYQYFFVLDDAWNDGGYWEYRTSRRQGDCTMPLFAAGMSQPYHPGYALIYDKTLSKCAKNPSIFLNVPWSGGLESSALGELLNHWSNPVDSDYVLPCNRPETFTYTDSGASLEVKKTGVGPETVTWKAFDWDGGTMTYTYVAP